jgi:Rrf2 family transcriptional regulator, iron-sulfur cluster assembly transcription factor
MLWSSACDYAIRAAVHLAEHPDTLVQLKDITRDEAIPAPFVGKVLQALVRADILRSVRGPRGGYMLAGPPASITLLAIKAAVDGTKDLDACVVGLGRCSQDQLCPLHDAFESIRESIRTYLATTTLADMTRARSRRRSRQSGVASRASRARRSG